MALPLMRRNEKRRESRVRPGGLAGLLALGSAAGLLLRRRKAKGGGEGEAGKSDVDVNAQYGVIVLRGEVDSDDQIAALLSALRGVDGVTDVRNLLHTPGTPVPMVR
jgi:hypothetical protein